MIYTASESGSGTKFRTNLRKASRWFENSICDERHSSAILAIVNEVIVSSTSHYSYVPQPDSEMEHWFESKKKGNYPIIGAETDSGILVGFASYGPFRNFAANKYSIEHSVYVEKSFRGKGVARLLLLELIKAAKDQGYHTMIGGIDSANEASIRLHRFPPVHLVW